MIFTFKIKPHLEGGFYLEVDLYVYSQVLMLVLQTNKNNLKARFKFLGISTRWGLSGRYFTTLCPAI
jgi:hypothetical protein